MNLSATGSALKRKNWSTLFGQFVHVRVKPFALRAHTSSTEGKNLQVHSTTEKGEENENLITQIKKYMNHIITKPTKLTK